MTIRDRIAARPLAALTATGIAGALTGVALTLLLIPVAPPPVPAPPAAPPPAADATAILAPIGFDSLPGWTEDAIDEARPALALSCGRIARTSDADLGANAARRPAEHWKRACARVMAAPGDRAAFRSALEENFVPHRLATADSDTGTFTGYYEAELNGSPTRGGAFQIPLFAPPADLISVALKDFVPGAETARNLPAALVGRVEGQRLVPYDTRTSIEADAFRDRAEAIMWIDDPIAANILHIQGSGRVTMPDGGRVRVGFAAHNGHSFTGIGKILLDEGVLKPGEASMIAVRDWLRKNPDRARALMARNARYIFFRRIEGDGPIGAEGVALTPLRSMAVDPRAVPLGAPVWLETEDPDGVPLKRLMVAQDVGAAIVGAVRGDVFWGAGEPAFEKAARMKSRGRAAVMLPRPP